MLSVYVQRTLTAVSIRAVMGAQLSFWGLTSLIILSGSGLVGRM